MNEDIRGKGAVGVSIAYYSLHGMVSIPLSPCDYNLIYDDGKNLNKIKVVSCSYKNPSGSYAANIRSSGGNQPKNSVKKFDNETCDYVFVVTANLETYSIPSHAILSKRQICLSMFQEYKVSIVPE